MDEWALSRRRFLQLATAGLAASGLSACAAAPTLSSAPKTTPALTPASTPAAAPPKVALSVGSFVSTFRPAEATHWTIASPVLPVATGTPPGAETRYPVALFLHGLHGDNRTVFDALQAQDVLQRHLAAGGTPFALASVDGGDWWWHRRSNGIDPQKMLLEEFLPLLQQRGLDTGRSALLGLSMGGFGALLLASQRKLPGLRAVAAMSPAIWDHFGVGIDGAFDNARDFAANDVFALRPNLANLPKRIDCGTEDELYPSVKDYVSGLNSPVEGGFQPGGHDAAYWRSILPDMVSFLGQHLG